MARIIAVIVLFIPGIIGAIGIKLMRDAVFDDYFLFFNHLGVQFVIGFILFSAGLAFIGGFIYHRDKKKQQLVKQRHEQTNE